MSSFEEYRKKMSGKYGTRAKEDEKQENKKQEEKKQSVDGSSVWDDSFESYRRKMNSRYGADIDAEGVKSWFTEVENTSKAFGDYTKANDGKWVSNYGADFTEGIGKLKGSAGAVGFYLRNHKSEFADYDSLSKAFSDYRSYLDEAEKQNTSMRDFYSQFSSEDEYNAWYERDKEASKFRSVLDAEDFGEYSQKGAGIENPTVKDAEGWMNIGNWHPFGDDVGNIVTYSRENEAAIRLGSNMVGDARYAHLTKDEVGIYNYYLAKYGEEKANEYLQFMDDELNQREAGKIAKAIDNTALEAVFSFGAGLDQFASGIKNIDNFIMGTEADPTTATQYAQGMLSENNKGLWKVTNDFINTTGNMLPSILVGTVTGGIGGAATIGVSAGGNAYSEMRKLGYDEWQSRGYAALVGASEVALSYFLGGISKLGGKVSGNAVSKLVSKVDNAIARTAIKIGGSMASEGLEEGIQTALEPAFKALMTGEEFESAKWDEILYSGLLGALSAGLLEGAPTIAGNIHSSYKTNVDNGGLSNIEAVKAAFKGDLKNAYNTGKQAVTENAGYYVNEALEIDPDNAHAQRMQSRIADGKNVSGYQINRLVEANENALVGQDKAKIKSAIESRLTELGETGDVGKLADALAKKVAGEDLSRSEKKLIDGSRYAGGVIYEMSPENIKLGKSSAKWAENIGTERINSEAYSRGITEASEASPLSPEKPSVTENATVKETAPEGKISASESKASKPAVKATMVGNDGNAIEAKVAGIAEVENGEASLELEGGQTVKASEVDFGDSGIGFVYNAATEMISGVGGFNVDAANVMVRGFDSNGSLQAAGAYVSGFNEAYRYGAMGYPVSALATGKATSKLSEAQREAAYNLGKAYGEGKVAEKQAKIDSIVSIKSGKDFKKASKKGKVYFDGSAVGKNLTERQRASLKGLRVVAEATGVNIRIFESEVVDGKRQGANGWYDPVTKEVHLDLHAGIDGNALMLYTGSHELTHHIREVSPAKFKVFADALLEEYTKNGVSIDELISRKLEILEANKRLEGKTDEEAYDLAYEAVVADACESMLVDSDAIEALSRKIQAKDKGLWETIKDFITKLVNRIRAAYEGVDPDSREGKLVREMKDSAERLQKLWVDALLEASEANVEQTLGESGVIVDSKTDSASLMSVRDLLTDADRKKVSKALAERFGATQSEAMEWLKAETSLASLILNPKYSQYLDYTADPNEEAIKSNSDYPQGTVDFSNICKKRRDFTEVMNRVLRNFPNHVFAATDLAKIRTIMEEEGMEVACAICYVEDRRQLDSVVAQDFIDSLALYRKGEKTRPDGKPFNANQLKAFSLIEGDTYTPSIYELISLEGRNSLKAKNPAMEEAWVKFNNARGMQSVRLLLNDAEYKRQILKYSPSVVKRKNDYGGLRVYSFSDMEMFHLIDIIQVLTDSATVGLSVQGYTKVNEYAKAVKDTGEKLNRSLIPKGDLGYHMENGRVVLDFDTTEGIDINHPDFFDNIDNPNIGNIVIGINATQIKAAMTSKFIDQIIPFHTGQSNEVLGEKGIAAWDNYKDFQSERDADTKKKSSHQINIYTEVINAAEAEGHPITNKVEFVNKFLEVCKENNLIPRFSDFLNVDENGDYVYTEGYHKFLVDFKTFDQNTGEYLPQMPVKPIFDNEYITSLLTDYVESQQAKDAELKKTMPKVLDRITKEIVKSDGVKFSDRDIQKSFGIRSINDYVGVQKAVINTLTKEGFFSDGNNIVVNKDSGMVVEITKDGIRETLGSGTRFQTLPRELKELKLSTIHSLPYLIETAHLDSDDVMNMHNFESKVKYAYLSTDVDVQRENGRSTYTVTITVRKSPQKNKFWIHEIRTIKKEQGLSSGGDVNPQQEYNKTLTQEGIIPQDSDSVKSKFSDRESYAPTFYSHMGKVIDDIKLEKMGTSSILNHLKNRGVKDEEIKWSGIETFLEGKKSVTKAELQEFVAGSQLQIEEEMSGLNQEAYDELEALWKQHAGVSLSETFSDDFDLPLTEDNLADVLDDMEKEGYDVPPLEIQRQMLDLAKKAGNEGRWSKYKLSGGKNYRELVFKMPGSTYSNNAMRGHWGQEAEGVLAHARIQDFIVNEKKMLFIEEIQSDWHNEGREKGYITKEYEDAVAVYDRLAEDYANKRRAFNKYVRSSEFRSDPDDVSKKKFDWLRGKMETAEKRMQNAERDLEALKKKGMGDVPDAPFRNTYHEYVLKRLLRMAAEEGYDSLGWTPSWIQGMRWSEDYAEGYRIEYDQDIPKFLRKYGKKWGAKVGETTINDGEEDFNVWSMDITDSMKDSVLYEGQSLYQDRSPDSYSNRSLLAGALETAAQNDIERQKLTQYKQKIDLINAEEQKLHKLREQIKELSFAKGPRDTAAIKSLQFEANQAANRINTYDRQLLNLESTKALKGVLEREKALARKKVEKQGKEALERYREKAAKTQRALMDRYQESRKKATEGRHKTAMRHKIKDVVNELNEYLLKGTKDKHVPIELQKAVAEALDAVNMDTVGAEERIAKKRVEMMSAKSPEVVERLAKEIEHIGEMGGNMEAKLSRLKTAYDSIINSDDPLVANSHDEVISNTIERVMEIVGNTPLRDMSLNQLEAVYDMYRMVLHSIRTVNKAFKAKKSEEISVIANRVMEEIDKLGRKKALQTKAGVAISAFDWNNQKPIYAFERIGSDTFAEVFRSVREGEDAWAVDMTEAKDFLDKQKQAHKYESWDTEKRYSFTSSTGRRFELSLDQIMSLYAYSKRGDQAKDHLKYGGFVFDGLTEVKQKTKLGTTRTYQLKDATAYNLSDEILAEIISKLSPEQKAFADEMQNYLSTVMGEKGNEVSLELYGVKLFKEKNYFPLKSAPQYLERAREQAQGDTKIKNKGFTKETTPKAKNPIVLTSFMDVWSGHVNEMSMYHAFTLALEDFYRVFNYKTPASENMDSEGVIPFIENAHGNAAVGYIDQLLKDLNGGARSDPRETHAKRWLSNFKKASVIASLSVVIQQPSAIVRAEALVDAKYFVGKKLSQGKHKEAWAEVKKYAPVAVIKEMGYFDTGMGQSSTEWLKGEQTWKNKMDDALSKAPALADELTWVAIWNAVKRETAHKNPNLKTNSEDFLKLAGERFTEVVTKTQVYDSTLARSANMRSKTAYMSMLTAFMAEPTTSINMLQDAIHKGNKRHIARTMGAVFGSVVLNSALVSLVYAMRDDDDDETFLEKYLSRFVTEVVDGVNPLTYFPFVKDIWSALQGFDIERADMTLITKVTDSMQQLVKIVSKDTSGMSEEELADHRKAVSEAILSITDTLSALTGLPVKNIRRDVKGIINGIGTIKTDIEGRDTTAGSLEDNILEDVKDSTPVWGWFPDESKGDKLYDAIIKGDTAYVDRLKSGYKSETAYQSAIRKALRENDPRIKEAAEARYNGDIAGYMKIAKAIIAEGHFKQDDVVAAINSVISAMDKGEESSPSDKAVSLYKIEDYYAALVNGTSSTANAVKEDIIATEVANGKDREEAEESFNSKFVSHIRELYESGEVTDYKAKDMLIRHGDKTEEEAASKLQYWSFKKKYPDYDLSESAVSKYYSEVADSGISVEVYYDYSKKRSKAQGEDLNGDGKTDSGSVKSEVLDIIDSLPISSYQKDALYYLNGWAKSKLYEAPWH